MSTDDLFALNGRRVTAKRLGWDEVLAPGADLDLESYEEHGYASPDLAGVLDVVRYTGHGGREGVSCLVGGQEADPKTVRPA